MAPLLHRMTGTRHYLAYASNQIQMYYFLYNSKDMKKFYRVRSKAFTYAVHKNTLHTNPSNKSFSF